MYNLYLFLFATLQIYLNKTKGKILGALKRIHIGLANKCNDYCIELKIIKIVLLRF